MTKSLRSLLLIGVVGSVTGFSAAQAMAQAAAAPPATPTMPAPALEPLPSSPATAAASTAPEAKATSTAQAGEDRERRLHDRIAFFNARLAGLQAGLMLTPDQQKLWPPVEQAIRDIARARYHEWRIAYEGQEVIASGLPAGGTDSTPFGLLKNTGEQIEQHGRALQSLADAAKPFFASLTAEQKDRLPVLLDGLVPRWGPVARLMAMLTPEAARHREDRGEADRGDDHRDEMADQDHDTWHRHGHRDDWDRDRMDESRDDHGWRHHHDEGEFGTGEE